MARTSPYSPSTALPAPPLPQSPLHSNSPSLYHYSTVTSQERDLAEKVIGRGEKIEAIVSREGEEEEAAEIALLNEEASRTRIDPELKKKNAMQEQQRLYEAEKAEAERIAATLGQPTGTTPIDNTAATKEAEEAAKKEKKERDTREKAEKKAEKDRSEREQKEAKAAAKAASDAAKAADKKAKDEADATKKIEEAKKKAEALEKQKKEKEEKAAQAAASSSPTIATKKEQAVSTPVVAETQTEAVAAVDSLAVREKANLSFTDARTGLSISTALSDSESVRSEPIVQPQAVPKRQTATEESIFGSDSVHRDLDVSSLPSAPGTKAKLSLFGDEDDDDLFFKKASAISSRPAKASAAPAAPPKPASKLSFDDDEDDDIMAMLSKRSSKQTSSASTAPKTHSDDIFAMLDSGNTAKKATTAKKTSFLDETNFDVDSFISSTKSSGGLFDD